ncbi:MAG: ethanolamine utilization protein EutJ [Oscillospiraceae bacterium]|nr:ethanolamine utilization protein EutJ [Oscillospiraceae bacterium]
MKKAKIVALCMAAAMPVSMFAGCKNSTTNANEIKIGLNYELSGDVAQYGISCVEGIELAVGEINAAGGIDGKQIKLVKIDNKSDNNEAMNVATKLATQEGVCAIMGPATSGAVKATNAVATKYKVPVISCSATADDVTIKDNKLNDYTFRICYNDSFQGKVMGDFSSSDLKAKKAIILADNANDYSKGLATAFKSSFTSAGGTIVSEENFTSTDKDFNAVLTKIKDKDFDIIYLPGYYEQVGLIVKQARSMGITKPILGADGYDSPDLAKIAGKENLTNVFFTNHYSSKDTSSEVTTFIDAFKKKYSKDPNAFHALGYDMAKYVVAAIKTAGGTDTAKIQQALANTKDFDAVTGKFTIDAQHNPVKSTVVIECKNGEQTFRTKIGG